MNRITQVSSFLITAAVCASAASAATISHTYSDLAGYYEIDRFDPSLGALTGVNINLQSEWDTAVEIYTYDEEGNWVPARFDYTAAITRTMLFGTSSLVTSYSGAGSINLPRENSYGFSVSGSSNVSLTGGAVDFFIGTDTFYPRDRSAYNLTGNLVLPPDAYGDWSFSDSDFSDIFKITYTYTAAGGGAVPEPASWAMMMVGFGGIGYAVRRKKKVAAALG